jgi:hypothetical protein
MLALTTLLVVTACLSVLEMCLFGTLLRADLVGSCMSAGICVDSAVCFTCIIQIFSIKTTQCIARPLVTS